jgi:hypothetical protein
MTSFRPSAMKAGFVALLLVGERLDILDHRIGKAGDFLHLANAPGCPGYSRSFGTQRRKE